MESIMAIRILTAAAVLVALAAPALADTISTDCYGRHSRASGSWRTCNTEIKRDPRPEPRRPIIVAAPEPYQPPRSETVAFAPRAEPAEPVDPKCRKVNACLTIYPGIEGEFPYGPRVR
jgi:hypothetical protein